MMVAVPVVVVVGALLGVVFVAAMPRPAPNMRKVAVSASARTNDRRWCFEERRTAASIHAQRSIGLPGQELTDEMVV